MLGLDSFCKQVEDTVDEMAFTSHGSLKLLKDFHCFLLLLYKPDPVVCKLLAGCSKDLAEKNPFAYMNLGSKCSPSRAAQAVHFP